jgi:hypothetical protein
MRMTIASIMVLLLAAVVVYSLVFKVWCLQRAEGWGGQRVWGEEILGEPVGTCIREKSLFSF